MEAIDGKGYQWTVKDKLKEKKCRESLIIIQLQILSAVLYFKEAGAKMWNTSWYDAVQGKKRKQIAL